VVADMVRTAREGAADEHRPEDGETNWSLGVRGFERTNHAIETARVEYPWLTVVSGGGGGPVQFVFAIGGHPIRVCRGDADEVPPRYQQPCLPELAEQQMVLDIDSTIPAGRCLRLVVENDVHGSPENIYLHEIDDQTGDPIRSFMIPHIAASGQIMPFMPIVEPANIPPVVAEPADSESEDVGADTKTGSNDE
jgi:hypothetical protein